MGRRERLLALRAFYTVYAILLTMPLLLSIRSVYDVWTLPIPPLLAYILYVRDKREVRDR